MPGKNVFAPCAAATTSTWIAHPHRTMLLHLSPRLQAPASLPHLHLPATRNISNRFRASTQQNPARDLRTCRNCKQQFDPLENHPEACHYHPAHFGGETKRKFESVYSGGTMDTIGSGEILQYWHCCGCTDAFHLGCETSPHASYDD